MKNIFIVSLIYMLISCGTVGTQIRGNGNIQTVERATGIAKSIAVTGSFHTVIVQGAPAVSITGDGNLQPYMITELKGDRLEVHLKYRTVFFKRDALTVKISMPDIESISLNGSGLLTGENINAGRLLVQLTGSGTIILPVHASSVEAELTGSGEIRLNGETNELQARINKSGLINSTAMFCKKADVSIMGSGKAKIFVSQSLAANISGSGNIYYSGNAPNVTKSIVHSGRVIRVQ